MGEKEERKKRERGEQVAQVREREREILSPLFFYSLFPFSLFL